LLIVHLLVSRYLGEAFSSTAYSVNVYIIPGELALRLTRFTRADILAGKGPRIHYSFRRPHQRKSSWTDATAGRKKKQPTQTDGTAVAKAKPGVDNARVPGVAGPSRLPHPPGNALAKKRPYEVVDASEEEDEDEIDELVDDIDEAPPSDAERSDEDGVWEYSLRPSIGTSKKRKVSPPPKAPSKHVIKRDLDDDVISLSSD